ncbi:hypothetical protein [Aeromonas veronii]|uniref:hypothetical protein n=1 Tax=Aeromonas veronii TaxID=654 RepID=UPI003B9FE8CC
MKKLIVTDNMLALSNRKGFISFFHRDGDARLYVFNQSVAKLQSYYKTPLRPLMLKAGVIYVTIAEERAVALGLRYNNPLRKKVWGYEQMYI